MAHAPSAYAVLAHGIDGLFLPDRPAQPRFVLARAGTPEFAWSSLVHGADRTIGYRTTAPSATTAGLLAASDVGARMRECGVAALLLSVGCAPQTRQWAQREGVALLMTAWRHQRRFEDKLRFDRFARQLGLPMPDRVRVVRGMHGRIALSALPAVVQEADSLGGEGTCFARTPAHAQQLADAGAFAPGRRVLVRACEDGVAYGVTLFVGPGRVELSAVRRQCYAPTADGTPLAFMGVQWCPSASVPWLGAVHPVLARLGAGLHAARYFGFANIDFLRCDDGRVVLIECNARMSAATPQLLRHHDLAGGIDLGARYLDGLRRRARWPAALNVSALPATTFAGATLDLVSSHSGVVAHVPRAGRWTGHSGPGTGKSGCWRWLGADVADPATPGEFVVVPLAQLGEQVEAGQSIATVLASCPLFDQRGRLLPDARALHRLLRPEPAHLEPADAAR
ncbi:MAG: hypothetical protein EXR79_10755 [Myxococcales bacterium]|nr:hypothetical protein [Myxococcales bacterium]